MCIRNVPLLASLNQDEIDKISEGVVFTDYKKGEYIFRSGDKADKLYIVVSGKMKISNYLSDGREQILYIYSAGDFVGAFNLLKEDEFKYNAEALEDTTISTLSKNKFNEIILKNPEITLKILEKSYERIRDVEGLVVRLSAANTDAKVAGLLLELMEDFGSKESSNTVLELTINREEMGNYAGIARETMTRKLNHFKELGYIDFIGNKKIIIKEENKLRELL
ncbi:MAG: Crp/Fnr family transcriptional regulator [Tissierellia bacterium]|nr:Crp/Fnr family transcriptional regulator [Tissierellia bacterium]